MRRLLLSLVMGLGTAMALAQPVQSIPSSSPSGGRPQQVTEEISSRQKLLNDNTFVEQATINGMTRVEASKLALKKSADPQVRAFAKRTIVNDTQTVRELRTVALNRQVMVPAKLDRKHQRVIDRLSGLSGDRFDRSYVKQMRREQADDVALFTNASSAQWLDPGLRVFAGDQLPGLQTNQRSTEQLWSVHRSGLASLITSYKPALNEDHG